MNKKLTLSIDQNILELAKDYARSYGITLSGMVEDMLRTKIKSTKIVHKKPFKKDKFDKLLDELAGSLAPNEDIDFDPKEAYRNYRIQKELNL